MRPWESVSLPARRPAEQGGGVHRPACSATGPPREGHLRTYPKTNTLKTPCSWVRSVFAGLRGSSPLRCARARLVSHRTWSVPRSGSSGVLLRSGSFGCPARFVWSLLLRLIWVRSVSGCAPVHSAVRSARVRLDSRCKRLRPRSSPRHVRRRLSSQAPARSARPLLMTILRSGEKRHASLHDHRNFRQPIRPAKGMLVLSDQGGRPV
jgi:hypothetical protein